MDFVSVPFIFNGKELMDCNEQHLAMKIEDIATELGCTVSENNIKVKVEGYIGDDYLSMAPLKYIFA